MADSTDALRDQLAHDFALQKLQAFYDGKTGGTVLNHSTLADASYNFADEMIRARNARMYKAAK